ncbi:ABC transporter ATP-binding protein [Desulfonema ishimotonii]|uniref:ABC transporter ATP-binding protein n=1 Tax=Desulfonema ishimotonii TaxID=45657 RepID=A0A401FVH8_9BACT|nr:ABC transporter ATP-binding protein [Desulfonema ishimotonii]GBC60987.1 ABC transporter ATP-binding protein [Desulfonema ishimotonii]
MRTKLQLIFPKKPPRTREAVLEVRELAKIYRVNASYLTVLENVRFRAATGELVCILGPSGCGKSTLLKIISGFIPPSSGKVILNGRPVSRPAPDRCLVFQEDALFPWLTVAENIAFGLKGRMKNKKAVRQETDRFLSLVGLGPFRDYLPREISGGMKQRVALARVLILRPRVLLMDEPFGALDAHTRSEMQNLLLSLWKKLSHTILFVTHDVNEAVTLADRILVMDRGPGCIRTEIPVGLKRPRKREDDGFHQFCRRLYKELRTDR